MFYVYVIQNEVGKIYIGYTSDLLKRLDRHNQVEMPGKKTAYTVKNTGVWKYVYTETVASKSEVMVREKQLKTSRGRAFIKNIVAKSQ